MQRIFVEIPTHNLYYSLKFCNQFMCDFIANKIVYFRIFAIFNPSGLKHSYPADIYTIKVYLSYLLSCIKKILYKYYTSINAITFVGSPIYHPLHNALHNELKRGKKSNFKCGCTITSMTKINVSSGNLWGSFKKR